MATIFSLTIKHSNTTHNKTLITQSRFLYKNGPKNFSRGHCPRTPKRLVHERSSLGRQLHELNLNKSPIKNHKKIYLGQVGSSNRIKQNQAPQSPTYSLTEKDFQSLLDGPLHFECECRSKCYKTIDGNGIGF